MISEVDIRDWDKVDFQKLESVVQDLTDEEYPDFYIKAYRDTIRQLEALREQQVRAVRGQIPALFLPKKEN